MTRLEVPPGASWEVLVVDNGADPLDPAVLAGWEELPLRGVREPNGGLSNARNCGVREARGRYICWTDDDVEVHPTWLSAYARAFENHPDGVVFGGEVEPCLEAPVTDWFARHLRDWPLAGVTARRRFGSEFRLSPSETREPWGVNFAIRADVQKIFSYRPALGAGSECERHGEESHVIRQILGAGHAGFWVPESLVFHIIPSTRQKLDYVRTYHRRSGRTAQFMKDPSAHPQPSSLRSWVLALPAPLVRALAAAGSLAWAVAWKAGFTGIGLKFLAASEFCRGTLDSSVERPDAVAR